MKFGRSSNKKVSKTCFGNEKWHPIDEKVVSQQKSCSDQGISSRGDEIGGWKDEITGFSLLKPPKSRFDRFFTRNPRKSPKIAENRRFRRFDPKNPRKSPIWPDPQKVPQITLQIDSSWKSGFGDFPLQGSTSNAPEIGDFRRFLPPKCRPHLDPENRRFWTRGRVGTGKRRFWPPKTPQITIWPVFHPNHPFFTPRGVSDHDFVSERWNVPLFFFFRSTFNKIARNNFIIAEFNYSGNK